jgi:hypothetical protein
VRPTTVYDRDVRLYYFTSLKTAAEHILPKRQMKLSQFGKVNDPFELLCADEGDKRVRHILKVLREHWRERLGFISMSSTWRNPVMWAHYSDSHYGVCLGFDVPDIREPIPMQYDPDRLKLLLDPTKRLGGFDESLIKKILTTKFKDWEYEHEWRVFGNLDERDSESGLYLVDFGPELVLREVIVGINCKTTVGQFAKLVRDGGPVPKSVTVFKTRAGFQHFEVVRQKQVTPIVIHPIRQA